MIICVASEERIGIMRWARVFIVGLLCIFVVGVGTAAASWSVRPGLPFVWVRAAPSSYAPAIYTLYPNYGVTVETTGNTQWDGYQTWTEVYVTSNTGIRGWVEQGSLSSGYQSWNPPQQPQQNPYPNNPPNNGWQQQGAWMPNWGGNAQTFQSQGAPPWGMNGGRNQGGWHP